MNPVSVLVAISGNELSAWIQPTGGGAIETDDPSPNYYFYLLRSGRVVERSGWTSVPRFQFELTQTGLYTVQGHIKTRSNVRGYSDSISFVVPKEKHALQRALARSSIERSGVNCNPEGLEIFLPDHPYVPWFFAAGAKANATDMLATLNSFAGNLGLHQNVIEKQQPAYLFTLRGNLRGEDEAPWLFSGSYFGSEEFVFGNQFLDSLDEVIRTEPAGAYSYCYTELETGTVCIGTDFFGTEKIYYAGYDSLFLASPSYHLLLALCSKLNLSLNFRERNPQASLAFGDIQVFHQLFSHEMNVQPILLLPVDKKISIVRGIASLTDTSLTPLLANPPAYSGEAYAKEIHAGSEELIHNVECVMRSDQFDYVLCDVSGGVDSRAVFAAVATVSSDSSSKKRVRLSTRDTSLETGEKRVAFELNSIFNLPFDDLSRVPSSLQGDGLGFPSRSNFLGNYFSFKPPSGTQSAEARTIRLTGLAGEVVRGSYYGSKLYETEFDVDDEAKFAWRYLNRFGIRPVAPAPESLDDVTTVFSNGLESVPGQSVLEKFDLHYLFFRYGLHGSDRLRGALHEPEAAPLQSKAMFRAKLMSARIFDGPKVLFDVINLIQPSLTLIPYSNQLYNLQIGNLFNENELTGGRPVRPNRQPNIGDAERLWKSARIRQEAGRSVSSAFESKNQDDLPWLISLIENLFHDGIVHDRNMVERLWHFWDSSSRADYSERFRENIKNRVLSLSEEARFVGRG